MNKEKQQKILSKLSLLIRIISVAPIAAFLLITIVYIFECKTYKLYEYILSMLCLSILPLLAYPIQRKFNIIKGDERDSERKLAVIFSCLGYIIGMLLCFVLDFSDIGKIIVITYVISGFCIALTSLIGFKASGHMCGISGPIAVIVYLYGYWFLFLGLLLIPVYLASKNLKRHKNIELIIGTVIPVISLVIAILLIA